MSSANINNRNSSQWKEVKLGEIYTFASGLSKPANEFGFGYPFLSFKTVHSNFFLPKCLDSLVNSTTRERERCSIREGDVFLTRTSETEEELGLSSVALKDFPEATFNGFTKRLRPIHNEVVVPKYVGYFLRSKYFRQQIISMASITTRASLNNSMLENLYISLPPLSEQKAIAEVLSGFDDKIDLLHRQNKTLEQMAETLFRQWFIEEAKEDWEEVCLGEVLQEKGYIRGPFGSALKRAELKDHGVPVYEQMNAIYNHRQFRYFIDDNKFQEMKRFQVQTGDIVISCSGTVGKITTIKEEDPKGIISQALLILRPNLNRIPLSFLYYFLNSREGFHQLTQVSHGSVQVNIAPRKSVESIKFLLPSKERLGKFNDLVSNIMIKIDFNNTQIRTLEGMRDSLLPKLMSGEVRVV